MKKSLGILITLVIIIVILPLAIYLKGLPYLVSNQTFINYIQNKLDQNLGVRSVITNPKLKTSFSPVITFEIDNLDLTSKKGQIICLENFKTTLSFKEIFAKNIIVKELGTDFIFIDFNKLSEFKLKENKKQNNKNDFNIDFFNSILYIKNAMFLYKIEPNTNIKITAKDLNVDNTQKVQRFVHFNLTTDITKADKNLHFNIEDKNSVYFKDNHFWVKNCPLDFNKSKIYFNANADRKQNFNLDIFSDKIYVEDILTLIDSQVIENNLQEPLSYFKNLNGSFNFNIKLSNNDINGIINLNKIFCEIVPISNIPLTLNQGKISLTKDKITLTDFKGFYNHKTENEVTMGGSVKDYLKSIDTQLTARSVITNDFMKNYLSKMAGTPIELTGGSAKTKLELSAKNNIIDMNWLFGISIGQDILLDGSSFSPTEFARGVKGDMHFENNILTIKSLDYYILPEKLLAQEYRDKIKPIIKFSGNIDIANNSQIKDLGFSIPEPMPSEFLNLLVGDKIFKKGKVNGQMYYNNNTKGYPILQGNLVMDMVAIPSQRVFVKHGEMIANGSEINLKAAGGYRRSKYDFTGIIANEVKFPIVVKNINLEVDNVDIEKFLASANNQNSEAIKTEKFDIKPSGTAKDDDDNTPTFDIGNFVVEKCLLKINNGKYKTLMFDNIEANLTLDKNSILNINSNKFNIANGQSSAKIKCDLKKHLYNMTLGVLNIDSDIIATNLLQMEREISGKASGIIDLNTDDSLKLNGTMKFVIKDGAIQKVGLVEYILKFAALFRNPLTMISPSIFSDLVNVPDGNFKEINGSLQLKNNVIEKMMIKSSSPQLSAFIVGRFDLETRDAALRIYTKFSNKNKGIYGALRNISLNSLANRIPLSTRSDSNYYSAELSLLPPIDADEKDCQVFLTKVDGDIEHNNFISSLKKIK